MPTILDLTEPRAQLLAGKRPGPILAFDLTRQVTNMSQASRWAALTIAVQQGEEEVIRLTPYQPLIVAKPGPAGMTAYGISDVQGIEPGETVLMATSAVLGGWPAVAFGLEVSLWEQGPAGEWHATQHEGFVVPAEVLARFQDGGTVHIVDGGLRISVF